MTKGQRTRRQIIEKAAPLLNRKGYAGTSLSDLMEATGLQKGGIYRHFSGKEELAGEVFDYSWERAVRGTLEGVAEIPDCVDRLKKMIANFVEMRSGLVPGGCPLMNTAVEADDGNSLLRARARRALSSWTRQLSDIVSEGIKKRQMDSRVDPLELSQLIIGGLEGALLLSRLQNTDQPLHAARQHLDQYLEEKVRAKSRGAALLRPSPASSSR